MDVVEHHQNPVAGPMIWRREDGQRDLAAEAEAAINFHPASRPRKFLILAVYECHRAILKKVFDLKSWTYRKYKGTMTPAQRRRAISEFENDESIMILLISNVGTTGLNITRASIGILMGGLWAAAEEDQTTGRLNRMGQLEAGVIYKVLARGTADEVLSSCANGKGMMGEFLFSKEMEWIDDDLDSNDESDKPATSKPRKSAVRSRKPKQDKPNQADGDGDLPRKQAETNKGDGDAEPPAPAKKPRSRKRKQAEADQGDGDAEPPAPPKEVPSRKRKQAGTDQADGDAEPPAPPKKVPPAKRKQAETNQAGEDVDPALSKQTAESDEQAAPAEPPSRAAPSPRRDKQASVPLSSSPHNPTSKSRSSGAPTLSVGPEALQSPPPSPGDNARASEGGKATSQPTAPGMQPPESAPQSSEPRSGAISDSTETPINFSEWIRSDALEPSSEPHYDEVDDHAPANPSPLASTPNMAAPEVGVVPGLPPAPSKTRLILSPAAPPFGEKARASTVPRRKAQGPQQASAAPVGSATPKAATSVGSATPKAATSVGSATPKAAASGVAMGSSQALLNKQRVMEARKHAMQTGSIRARSPPRHQPSNAKKQAIGVVPKGGDASATTQSTDASQGASGSQSSRNGKKKFKFLVPRALY
ncbi:hypothetical protein FRC08_004468 [Ceratobasidium sp. 394]|nr:hypothetical protein FRC08_004468 [Ceratobasidium sp. 394]